MADKPLTREAMLALVADCKKDCQCQGCWDLARAVEVLDRALTIISIEYLIPECIGDAFDQATCELEAEDAADGEEVSE